MTLVDMIASVERTPLHTPFVTALRRVEHVESVRVMLLSASGLVGIGEAPPTVAITGEDSNSIIDTIKRLRPLMLQLDFQSISEAMVLLHGVIEGHSSAKAAVDMALYDLFAKEVGLPLYRLLGGELRPIVTDVTISLNAPGTMASDTLHALERGFDILKVKVGGGNGQDIERIRAVRDAAGKGAVLLVDANQAWDEAEALQVIDAVQELEITLIEQPLPAADLEGMRRVTESSSIPILADESAFTLEAVRHVVETKAADMINIKLMKCGGIYKARKIIEYCKTHGISCMMGSMLEGPVSIAAAMHLSMAYSGTIRWHDLDSPLLYRSLSSSAPVRFEKNRLYLKNRVGI